jgi:molecular chaperone Hsp33
MVELKNAEPVPGDRLVRALALDATVRVVGVCTTGVAQRLAALHEASPLAAVALARVSTGALLMGALVKGREQVGLQLNGNGPLGGLYAVADARGHVRVSIDRPQADLPLRPDGRLDLPSGIGLGRLTVTKTVGTRAPYTGITPIVSGEIADDLAQYFLESEQKPTAFALAERLEVDGVRAAGGWLIQALPGADDAALARLEARIAQAPPLSQALAGGATPEAIVGDLFGGTTVEILESYPVRVYCPCERERFERVLIGLGRAELEDMAQSQAATELVCHFCNTRYFFSAAELHALGAEA